MCCIVKSIWDCSIITTTSRPASKPFFWVQCRAIAFFVERVSLESRTAKWLDAGPFYYFNINYNRPIFSLSIFIFFLAIRTSSTIRFMRCEGNINFPKTKHCTCNRKLKFIKRFTQFMYPFLTSTWVNN